MWSPASSHKSKHSTPGVLKRTFKTSFTGSSSPKSATSDHSSDGETPIAQLRVQIIGCQNLPSADLNGKSDPFVVLTFGRQRAKTPIMKKTLNPKYPAKDSTFELPIYASAIETRGAFLDFVVWDKDMVGRDYLAELSLTSSQWFKRKSDINGSPSVLAFDDPSNNPISFPLTSSKTRRRKSKEPNPPPPTIQLKLGLVPLSNSTSDSDLPQVFAKIVEKAQKSPKNLFSLPPTQGLGTVKSSNPTLSRQSSTGSTAAFDPSIPTPILDSSSPVLPPKDSPQMQKFRINWDGTHIDYNFSSKKDVAGILMLEIKAASNLPKVKNWARIGWDMDPFIVIKYGEAVYRTKVVRHELNPTFNDKFILFVRRSTSSPHIEPTAIKFSLMDWEKMTRDHPIGEAVLDVLPLMDLAPKPDPETALYSEEAMRLHGFEDVALNLSLDGKSDRWDISAPSTIIIRAKYEAHNAMRQRFWRHFLKEHDLNHSGQFSHDELIGSLSSVGLQVSKESLDSFVAREKDPLKDELTIEEAMQCIEGEFGSPAPVRRRSDSHPLRRARSSMFGHSRDSMYDLELQLKEIFASHPQAYYRSETDREENNPIVPASAIPEILASFSELHGLALLEEHEEANLRALVEAVADTEIGPDFLVAFIAKATGAHDNAEELNLLHADEAAEPSPTKDHEELGGRGRTPEQSDNAHSRASSRDSIVTSIHIGHKPSIPQLPSTPKTPSPFDVRQRSTPLEATAPSSWSSRPIPASKRRRSTSSVGSASSRMSDGEGSPSVSTFGSRPGSRMRARAPSNPPSPPRLPPFIFPPRSDGARSASPSHSPPPRPGSRSVPSLPVSPRGFHSLRSPGHGSISNPALPILLDQRTSPPPGNTPSSMDSSQYGPSSEGADNSGGPYDEDEDPAGRQPLDSDQTSLFSLASSATGDRVDDLERFSTEQSKKLQELQRTLEDKMADHELEMEELHMQREEIEAELAQSKRDEKELRAKDHNSSKQLTALESEVSRLQRSLEASKASYHTLQKQYLEQCAEAEKYRDTIRRKDLELKDSEAYVAISEADSEKWKASAETAHQMIESISTELEAARTAVASLDSQKQENLSLKETIDRLRFELDELRTANSTAQSNVNLGGGSGTNSLAQEMRSGIVNQESTTDDEDLESEADTVVENLDDDDYVETVITRRKKLTKGSKPSGDVLREELVKEYSDSSTQHFTLEFRSEASSQTIPVPTPVLISTTAQTEEEPQRYSVSSSVQTEYDDEERSHVSADESIRSSPLAGPSTSAIPSEDPPSYAHLLEEERERIGLAEVAKWHTGLHSTAGLPQGISSDALNEWSKIKSEIGFTCLAIDKVMENTEVYGPRPAPIPKQKADTTFLNIWTAITITGIMCFLTLWTYSFTSLGRGPFHHDRRMWDIYNDISGTGVLEGFTHGYVDSGWSALRKTAPGAKHLGWVPT